MKAPGPAGLDPAMGPNDAKVKVIVFSDFQCPVCRRAVEPLKKIVRDMAPDVQVIWRNHPLPSHARAEPAARAAMAAFRQGKFWEVHDRFFEAQSALSDDELRQHAAATGLDLAQFDKDLVDPALAKQVADEAAQAEALGAAGTPAFFVNGEKTVGWGSMMGLRYQIEQALKAGGGKSAEEATRAKDPAVAKLLFGK
ncbi:MAG: thioredoxin domain-containing protein [Myxococcota bacterium]